MKLGCLAGVEYKNKIIFTATHMNGLFELDMNTGRVQFIKAIRGEKCEAYLFHKAFLFENKAWFIPKRGNNVICVDLNTYYIEYFELLYNNKYEGEKNYPYSNYYVYIDGLIVNERYLYCIPNGLDSVLVIDLKEHRAISVNINNDIKQDFVYGAYFYQGEIHLLSQKGLLDKTIRTDKNDVKKKNWKFDSRGFLSSVQSSTNLYLIPAYVDKEKNRRLAIIDLITEETLYIDMPDTPEEYYGGMFINNFLLLLPDFGLNFMKLNIEKRTFENSSYPHELKDSLKNCYNGARIITSKERKLISFTNTGYILEFDEDGNISNYFDISKVEYGEVKKIIAEYKKKDIYFSSNILNEELLSLSEYIQLI